MSRELLEYSKEDKKEILALEVREQKLLRYFRNNLSIRNGEKLWKLIEITKKIANYENQ